MSDEQTTSVEKHATRAAPLRPPVGLLVSIGEPKPDRGPGRSIPYFRFKAGQLDQYADAAEKAETHYGTEAASLDDLYFLAATPPEVLEIRLMAFSQSGLRGVGLTNYAGIPDFDEFMARAWLFDDDFMFRPKNVREVRKELRETWEGEPIYDRLTGPDDPRIKKLEIKLTASLSFCMPEVMGIGSVAQIMSSGRASTKNLYRVLWDHYRAFGTLVGYPFRLSNRPKRTERFDREKREWKATHVRELVLDTPFTFGDVLQRLRDRQTALGASELPDLKAITRVAGSALDLPPASDEERQLRDEPTVEEHLSDALLNRIAKLEEEAGEMAGVTLSGVFGVSSAAQLGEEDATRYEAILEAHLSATALEGEVVNDPAPEIDF